MKTNTTYCIGDRMTFCKIASKVWWNCEIVDVTNTGYKVITEDGKTKEFKFGHVMPDAKKSSQ